MYKTHYCSGIILTNYYIIIVLYNIVRVKNTVFNPRDDCNKQELHSNGPRCKVYFGGSCIFYMFLDQWIKFTYIFIIFNHIHHRLLKVDVSPWLRGRLSHVTRDAVVGDETCVAAEFVAIIYIYMIYIYMGLCGLHPYYNG